MDDLSKARLERLWKQTQGAVICPAKMYARVMGFNNRHSFIFFLRKLASNGFLKELANESFEWVQKPDGTLLKKEDAPRERARCRTLGREVPGCEVPRKRTMLVGFADPRCNSNQGLWEE